MSRHLTVVSFILLVGLQGPAVAVEVLTPGFSIDRLAEVEGVPPMIEAIPPLRRGESEDASFGSGVMRGVMDKGMLTLDRLPDSDSEPLVVLGPWNETASLFAMRFDTAGQFGGRLIVAVIHSGPGAKGNSITDIWAIDPRGEIQILSSIGSPRDPVNLKFDISDGSGGYEAGMYLQDTRIGGGSSMYHIDPSLAVKRIGKNFLPPGRHDLDVRGVRFDRTGLYTSSLFLSDTDDHDKLSGIYLLDDELVWREMTLFESLDSRTFGPLAFSNGGALDMTLYVADRGQIFTVSPTGALSDFAKGFDAIGSITVSDGGSEMFISDRASIYRIRETE
jgi:hypothetical protein